MDLLDTTILVDLLRKKPAALTWLRSTIGKPAVSVVSLTELYAGARNRREEQEILVLERAVRLLALDRDIAVRAGYSCASMVPAMA